MIRRNEAKGTDGALKISAALGKRKTFKRCKISVCVVAFHGVPTESVAASQADSNVATPRDGIQRGPVAFEKMGPGGDTRIASRKIAPVYCKLIIGKDLSPEKIASQLRSAFFAVPQFFYVRQLDERYRKRRRGAVWSFFDEFEVESENPYFKAEDGVLLSKDGKTLYRRPSKKRGATHKVPTGVEDVEEKAFAYCGFERIELPESLRTIKKRAFLGCDALKSATLPANIASLGIEQRVRLVVEETPVFAALAATVARRREELENLARDLSKEPDFVDGAFLTGWETFADAPGGYVGDAAQDDVATFAGGLELVFAIE